MRLKLINRKIEITKNGTLVFTADMFNDVNVFENPSRLPKFSVINQALIQAIVNNPKEFEYVDNMFPFTWEADTFYLKIDKDGKPCVRNGKAVLVKSLTIWQKKVKDPDTGELLWVEDPMVTIHRIIDHYYIPTQIR